MVDNFNNEEWKRQLEESYIELLRKKLKVVSRDVTREIYDKEIKKEIIFSCPEDERYIEDYISRKKN